MKTISYLVSEQIPDHLCVGRGCSQVKGCHLVHVCVWEPEHSCLPQKVHGDTGKDNYQLVHAWYICVRLVKSDKHKTKKKTSKFMMCCFLHSHVAPGDRMMKWCFSLQVNEAQISSILHHLVNDIDVPLPYGRQKYKLDEVQNKKHDAHIVTLSPRESRNVCLTPKRAATAHLQPKWKAVCPASHVMLGSAPLLRKRSTMARLPWRAA